MAYYKAHTPDEEGWKDSKELPRQINLLRAKENINGYAFFRAASFKENPLRLEDTLKQMNNYYCVSPPMPWLDSIPTLAPTNLQITTSSEGVKLTWEEPEAATDNATPYYYFVYRFPLGEPFNIKTAKNIIGLPRKTTFLDNNAKPNTEYYYIVTSADRLNNESLDFIGKSIKVK